MLKHFDSLNVIITKNQHPSAQNHQLTETTESELPHAIVPAT